MKGLFAMFATKSKTVEAEAISHEIRMQRMRVENASRNLVKALDEMVDDTNRANRRHVNVEDFRNKRDH